MRQALFILGMLLGVAQTGHACSIPVFRYALEHWASSPYTLTILHKKPVPANEIEDLRNRVGGANVKIDYVNLTGPIDPKLQKQIDKLGPDFPVPYAFLKYPDHPEKAPPLYSGPVNSDKLDRFLRSPVREKIFSAMMRGESGVILLLESDDPEKNKKALEHVERELPKIIPDLPLPTPTEDGPQLISVVGLRKSFTVIRVSRTGDEEGLAQILLNCDPDLAKEKGPILFPVFGRGRVLTNLNGPDLLNKATLKQALEYVCKACSCQVKELNPGVDLLMGGDWTLFLKIERGPMPSEYQTYKGIETRQGKGEPEVGTRGGPPNDLDVAVMRDGTADLPSNKENWRPVYYGVGIILVLLVLIWIRSRV